MMAEVGVSARTSSYLKVNPVRALMGISPQRSTSPPPPPRPQVKKAALRKSVVSCGALRQMNGRVSHSRRQQPTS